MKKVLPFCLSVLLACFGFVSIVLAQDLSNLKIDDVICPSNGTVTGSVLVNTPLDVTVKVNNESSSPITITRVAVALSGNPVSSIGGAGLWGPFPRYLSPAVTVPAYGTNQFSVRIVGSVPSSLKGKMAGAGVTILSDDPSEPNRPSSGGGCIVIVQ